MRVPRAPSPRPAASNPATRNQAPPEAGGSLLPLWEKGSADCYSYLISGGGIRSSTPHPLAVAIFARNTNFETYPCKPFTGEG